MQTMMRLNFVLTSARQGDFEPIATCGDFTLSKGQLESPTDLARAVRIRILTFIGDSTNRVWHLEVRFDEGKPDATLDPISSLDFRTSKISENALEYFLLRAIFVMLVFYFYDLAEDALTGLEDEGDLL